VPVTEAENALAICRDEEESGTTGTVISDGDGKITIVTIGKVRRA
jgi:hypothetical protein